MPHLKQIERSATVGFCPTAPLLAAGTVAGAIDMSFSTNSVLEVFMLDFASKSEAVPLAGSVQAPERFNRIAWGTKLSDSSPYSYGLLAGGLADGSVCLWDPAAILGKTKSNPILAKMQKHTGAVKGLEFNSYSPNLLASGAADSDLCIWDLAQPAKPSLYPALKGGQPAGVTGGNEITYIAWNRKVQHILASTSTNGSTVVWDLKRQRPVISFRDPNSQRRCSALQWNPEVATQLIVASDDDRSPTLQMWDLRNSVSPLKEFVAHTKGVLGMAWCPQDASLLLSSAKDNRTICWDVTTGDIVCELPESKNWNFDVQWCPTIPGIFSTSSFDGKVGIFDLDACTVTKMAETFDPTSFSVSHVATGESIPLKKAPAWLKRPCGATFGFGGKLVSFSNQHQQVTDPNGQVKVVNHASISLKQLVTEPELVARSEGFEQAIAGGEKGALKEFCSSKAGAAEGEDAEMWSFLGVLFEEDARRQLLAKLGFADAVKAADVSAEAAAAGMDQLQLGDGAVADSNGTGFFEQELPAANPEEFFDNLPPADLSAAPPPPAADKPKDGMVEEPASPLKAAENEEEIQRALFVGNYDAAVEACFKASRMADALLIANIGGAELYKRAMSRYMRRQPRPYMQVVNAMVENDYLALVKTRPVSQWKETLAVLATYTAPEQWATLCDALAARLAQAGMNHAASLCYICAGNVDQAVAYWTKSSNSSAASMEVLQGVIEKSVVMGLATSNRKASPSLSELVTQYASTLAAQGRLTTAMEYLDMVPGEASLSVAVLKDRVYKSGAATLLHHTNAPPFPFIMEEVQGQASTSQGYNTQGAYGAYSTKSQNSYGKQHAGYGQSATSAYGQPAANAYGQSAQPGYGQSAQPGYGQSAQPAYGATSSYSAAGASTYQQPYRPGSAAAAAPAANPYQPTPAPTAPAPTQPSAQQYQAAGYGGAYATQQQSPAYGTSAQQAAAYSAQQQPSSYSAQQQSAGYGSQQQSAAYTQQQPAAYGAQQQAAGYSAQQNMYSSSTADSGAGAAVGAVYTAKRPSTASGQSAPPALPPAAFIPGPAPAAPAAPYGQPMMPAQPTATTAVGTVPRANAFTPAAAPAPPAVPTQQYAQQPYAASAQQYGAPAGMPSILAPAHPGSGGMPGSAGPGTPAAPKPAAPPAPAGPPANINIQSADTSKVAADQKPVVASLTNLFNACAPLANNPGRKKEMDDTSKRIGTLFWKLNAGEVSAAVVQKLLQLCRALDSNDLGTANHVQAELTTSHWDECGTWLTALKRMLKARGG